MGEQTGIVAGLDKITEIPIEKFVRTREFIDKNIIKIFDGIAGSGKSTIIHNALVEAGIEYMRFVPTNKLARDLSERFHVKTVTIASGLFSTKNGTFYHEMKRPHCETIVIDEILQSDHRVFDWIDSMHEEYNIIICTDSKQMLAPEQSKIILSRYEKLKEISLVIYCEKTKRAIDSKTEDMYNKCYAYNGDNSLFAKLGPKIKIMSIDKIAYNENDMYICHSNEIERELYVRFNLYEKYDTELIPKGKISANPPKDFSKYPILPQCECSVATSGYLQIANVATPTRFQGTEGGLYGKVYFLIGNDSVVSDREFYTVVTRSKMVSNLILVRMGELGHKYELKEYNGKPVKDLSFIYADESVDIDGEKLSELMSQDENGNYKIEENIMNKLIKMFRTDESAYFSFGAIIGGKMVTVKSKNEDKAQININKIIVKESVFDIDYMDEFMKKYELCQVNNIGSMKSDYLYGAMSCYQELGAEVPFISVPDYLRVKDKREYQYGIDLKSSYIHILKNIILPSKGKISMNEDDGIPWYIAYCTQCAPGAIVTGDYVKELIENENGSFFYICSTPGRKSKKVADEWHCLCHKDRESNEKIKSIKWGIFDRPWIDADSFDCHSEPRFYVRNKRNNKQLIMAAIRSEQARVIMKVRKIIYGDIYHGYANADCLYFDYNGDIRELSKKIEGSIKGYDFRVFINSKEDKNSNIVYQNYNDILSKAEIKNLKERERRRLTKR